jgi:hypothetical protein
MQLTQAPPRRTRTRRRRRVVLEVIGVAVVLVAVVAAIVLRGGGDGQDLGSQPELARELLAMERADQRARNAAIEAGGDISEESEIGQEIARVDRRNTARLKEIIDDHGWPGRSLVGERASRSAWLLALHADLDPKFQKQALELMEAMEPGEVDPRDVAYLKDRVLVAAGDEQIYGTQWECRGGEAVPRTPIVDPDDVDQRRAEVGMDPLDEYIESFRETYGDCKA